MKNYIVIPAYNESKVLREVLENIKSEGYNNIVVVDDGSKDNTIEIARSVPGVIGLRHAINRGAGAATITAIEAAKELGAEVITVFDADGQHEAKDIKKMIEPILNGECDVVLSKRDLSTEEIPFIKVVYNYIGNFITWILLGLWVSDSQCGFRSYSKKAAEMINTQADEYEYSSMVIREIKKYKLSFKEVPIKVYYTEHSQSKLKKQGFIQGVKTLAKLVWHSIT